MTEKRRSSCSRSVAPQELIPCLPDEARNVYADFRRPAPSAGRTLREGRGTLREVPGFHKERKTIACPD